MKKLILPLFILFSTYALAQNAAKQETFDPIKPVGIIKNLSDSALLDVVQRQTFRYFWDFGHPVSGLARERSNVAYDYGDETVTTGGSGFGIMALIVADHRKWISHEQAVSRMLRMAEFLDRADEYHGVFSHWMNGATGKTIRFGRKDDGGDLVETSYLFEGLLCARQYFTGNDWRERRIRDLVNQMWSDVEWMCDLRREGGEPERSLLAA